MSDTRNAFLDYLDLWRRRPDLFETPDEGGISVLREESGQPDIGVRYRDAFILLLKDAVRFPDGRTGAYIRLLHPPERGAGVAVFGMRDGEVVLVRQFRHATRAFHLELPRGFGDPGEAPEETARREIREETGLETIRLEPLGETHPDTGLLGSASALFLAELRGALRPAPDEAISSVLTISLDDLTRRIADGAITDGFLLAAFARLKALRRI